MLLTLLQLKTKGLRMTFNHYTSSVAKPQNILQQKQVLFFSIFSCCLLQPGGGCIH